MQYFDPPKISEKVLKKANISRLIEFPIIPFDGAAPKSCLNNVRRYVSLYGGKPKFGWILSIMGNIALKLTAHVVVEKKNGDYLCVTPNEYRNNFLRFYPDDSVESLIENDCLPLKFVSLIDSDILEEYLDIEKEVDRLRISGSGVVDGRDSQLLTLRAQTIYGRILELARSNTHKNDYCFCGSNKLNKKCCR